MPPTTTAQKLNPTATPVKPLQPVTQQSSQYGAELQGLRERFANAIPANKGEIQSQISSRVDNFRPQYQELAQAEADIYAAPAQQLDQYNQQYGQVGGPSAMNRLSSVLQNIGQKYGTRDVLANAIDQSRGRVSDVVNDIYNQYNQQREGISQEYNMLAPLYQTATGLEESQRGRDFTAGQSKIEQDFRNQQFGYQQEQDRLARDWQQKMFDYQKEQDAQAAARSGGDGGFGGGFGFDPYGGMGGAPGDLNGDGIPDNSEIQILADPIPQSNKSTSGQGFAGAKTQAEGYKTVANAEKLYNSQGISNRAKVDAMLDQYNKAYGSGKMTNAQYQQAVNQIKAAYPNDF